MAYVIKKENRITAVYAITAHLLLSTSTLQFFFLSYTSWFQT